MSPTSHTRGRRPGPAHANPEALPWVFLRMFTSPTASAFALVIALVVVW